MSVAMRGQGTSLRARKGMLRPATIIRQKSADLAEKRSASGRGTIEATITFYDWGRNGSSASRCCAAGSRRVNGCPTHREIPARYSNGMFGGMMRGSVGSGPSLIDFDRSTPRTLPEISTWATWQCDTEFDCERFFPQVSLLPSGA